MTGKQVEPRPCYWGRRKNDAFTLSATLLFYNGETWHLANCLRSFILLKYLPQLFCVLIIRPFSGNLE